MNCSLTKMRSETYIFPAKEPLAAATVDIVHCMQSSQEMAILVGTKTHIHPGRDIHPD
jgi:hypothetical protein